MPACPSCNASIEPWVNPCPRCGTTLMWDLPSAPQPPAVVPQETPIQPEEADDRRSGYLLILGVMIIIFLCCACACLTMAVGLGLLEAGVV
jgi:hypothetical protein